MRGGSFLGNELVKRELMESWKRSASFGVDKDHAEVELLSSGELKERKEQLNELFQSASRILENLALHLKNSPFMVVVSDRDGYIVSTWGDSPFTNKAKKVWLDCGANWHERVKGTNAIGTSLIEKKSICVIGDEHYVRENVFLACYASPLYSATGELIGILDVSGDARFHHPHTMGMVMAAAQACQSNLLLNSVHRELILSLKEMNHLTKGHSQPLISINEDGVIKRINQQAATLFNETPESCIGRPLTYWLDAETAATVLSIGEATSLSIKLKGDSKKVREWLVEPIRDERQRLYRMVMTSKGRSEKQSSQYLNHQNSLPSSPNIVAYCPKVQRVFQLAMNVAKTNATILISGETGTGKEVIAKEIHRQSKRKGSLVVVNCGAIPEQLLESELFGYEKGAFTGASKEGFKGKFRAANGGTLFLDEIGEMPLASQVALLRVLEEKRVTPVGSNEAIPIDVRIIAATNRDLVKEIEANRFRADLYYRLCEIEIVLPPLRKRTDLLELAQQIIRQMEKELQVENIQLTQEAKKKIFNYHWPGNIRELRQVIRKAVYHMCFVRQSVILTADDFNFSHLTPSEKENKALSIEEHEQETIAKAIEIAGGNLSKAARLLNIGRTTLYRKLNQYPHLKKVRCQANVSS